MHSEFPFSFIITVIFFSIFSSVPVVKSDVENSVLRLPSEPDYGDICPLSVKPVSCPVNCFRTDPVCGVDGITYWCGCAEALCAGTKVAKVGYCDVGNAGLGPVSGQAFLLVHIIWLIVLGVAVLFGLF